MNDLKDPDIHIKLNITSKHKPNLFRHPLRINKFPGEDRGKEKHFYYMTRATDEGNIRIETNFKMRK